MNLNRTQFHHDGKRWTLLLSSHPKPHECRVRGCRTPRRCYLRRRGDGSLYKIVWDICAKHQSRLYRANSLLRYRFNNLRHHAKERSIRFTVTFDQFCRIPGINDYATGTGQGALDWTVDRIRNSKGYCRGNLRVITRSHNSIKKHHYERRSIRQDPF